MWKMAQIKYAIIKNWKSYIGSKMSEYTEGTYYEKDRTSKKKRRSTAAVRQKKRAPKEKLETGRERDIQIMG